MRLTDTATRISLKNVLLATDFSPASEGALQFAERIARRYGSKLFAAHVISPLETEMIGPERWAASYAVLEQAARNEMQRLASRLQGLPHQMVLRHGAVWDVLSELVEQWNIDLLVVGTHGRSGFERLLMGSVAEDIFRQAPCPVLTVGPKASAERGKEVEFSEIVFATDFSPESLAAAPYALSLAQDYQARITLVHVVTEHIGPLTAAELVVLDRMKDLRSLVSEEAGLWCRPEYVVKFGDPVGGILEAARENHADLIVMGVRPAEGHLAAATHISTATAHSIVSLSTCPVPTVRG
jgi:nucleotide-binding universal stress UspA family protein